MKISKRKELRRAKRMKIKSIGNVVYKIDNTDNQGKTLPPGQYAGTISDVKLVRGTLVAIIKPDEKLCLNCGKNKKVHDERVGMCYFGMSMFANFRGVMYTWRPDLYCPNCLEKTVAGRINCSHCGRDY